MAEAIDRPRDRTELATALERRLLGASVPRSSLSRILELLEEQGFLTFDRPLDAADHAHLVGEIERAGFRVSRRPKPVS